MDMNEPSVKKEIGIEEKSTLVENYIRGLAKDLNREYPNIANDDAVERAIDRFKDSPKSLDEIKKEIDMLVQKRIADYVYSMKHSGPIPQAAVSSGGSGAPGGPGSPSGSGNSLGSGGSFDEARKEENNKSSTNTIGSGNGIIGNNKSNNFNINTSKIVYNAPVGVKKEDKFDFGISNDKVKKVEENIGKEVENNKNINIDLKQLKVKEAPKIKSFKWHSKIEEEIVGLKIQKNGLLATKNPRYNIVRPPKISEKNNEMEKPKVKVLENTNKGFINITIMLILLVIIVLTIILLFILLGSK